jgi:hypothetical protein
VKAEVCKWMKMLSPDYFCMGIEQLVYGQDKFSVAVAITWRNGGFVYCFLFFWMSVYE